MSDNDFDFIEVGPLKPPATKLVFVLHGYGRNAETMKIVGQDIAAAIPNAKIILPNAPEPFKLPERRGDNVLHVPEVVKNGKGVNDPKALRQWFSIHGGWTDVHKKIAAVVPRLNKFIDKQRDLAGLEDKDIAILGFSQGGGVGLYTAYMRDKPIASLVAHSTVFIGDTGLKSKPPTLFIYGDKDEEFTEARYKEIISKLRDYLGALETSKVPGLKHKTSAESRRRAASFIKKHFEP